MREKIKELVTDAENQPSVLVLHLKHKIISALDDSLMTMTFPDEYFSHEKLEVFHAAPEMFSSQNIQHSKSVKT